MVSLAPAVARADGVAVVKTADGVPEFDMALDALRRTVSAPLHVESLAADRERWPRVREKLTRREPVVWVALGRLALHLLMAEPPPEPVVFLMVATPRQILPEGATGVAGVTVRPRPDDQLRELSTLLPSVRRLGVLFDPSHSAPEVTALQEAARARGLTVETAQMSDPTELGGSLRSLLSRQVDVLFLVPDRTVTPPGNREAFEFIAGATIRAGLPVIGYASKLTENGALLSLGPDYADIGAQAGEIVTRVLAGENADDIGIQSARTVQLTLNMKVASTLGISLPDGTRERAAQVFR